MRKSAFAAALAAAAIACGVPNAPAFASVETEEAKAEAASAAETAREQMAEVFGHDYLENGRFLWKNGATGESVTQVVVSLSDQLAYAFAGDQLVGVSTISSGTDDHPTPTGQFTVLDKNREYRSIKYDNAPMPFALRIDDFGVALHAGALPGHPASHGCIRLPKAFAAKLFGAVALGTEVLIAA